ncbi:MAG: phosphoesterase, partial [Acidobacteriota bacterium]|nr:phosphoesterase [Acidobacteriota bacterium]
RAGSDFWPGEFHKTWVHAQPTYAGVLDGLRQGRMFAVAGDLVTELDFRLKGSGGKEAELGGALRVARGAQVTAAVGFRDPETPNAAGENPAVRRVDVIVGEVVGRSSDPSVDRNPTTRVLARFTRDALARDGDQFSFEAPLPAADRDLYVRIRGTSTDDLEPPMDGPGENPWHDLWFYSNPIFIEVE